MDWWCGCQQPEDSDPIPGFRSHLARIRNRLPADLLALQESVSLHDSHLRKINLDTRLNTLEIRLDGDDGRGSRRQLRLSYTDVVSFYSIADPDTGLPGPHGYGDLGYDEADGTDDGHFEHRLLFSTGIELQIVFGGFKLEWQDDAT